MQRVSSPELQGRPRPRRHRRQPETDRVVVWLKVATALAAAGLLTVILVWANAGSEVADPAPAHPRVPSGGFDDAPATTTTGPTIGHLIQGPELHTDTANIVGTATPTQAPPSTSGRSHHTRPPRTNQPGFGVPQIGGPCPATGMYSITQDFQPVVCQGNPPVWRRVF